MATGFINLVVRDTSSSTSSDSTMDIVLITLLTLAVVGLLAVAVLLFMRYRRRSQMEKALPLYNEKRASSRPTHRRITVRPSESIYVYQEKQNLLANSEAPPSPTGSVPEIRITFPEEVDAHGKTQSGRVVVVHVGEKSMGLEPCSEKLPPYQQSQSDRFQSLDLERIGGLQEKEIEARWL